MVPVPRTFEEFESTVQEESDKRRIRLHLSTAYLDQLLPPQKVVLTQLDQEEFGLEWMVCCIDNFQTDLQIWRAALIAENIAGGLKSPAQFFHQWSIGALDLPHMDCSVDQAYQAYLKWCLRAGERYPFKREQFTPTLLVFAESLGKFAQIKVMKAQTGDRRAVRMLLTEEQSGSDPKNCAGQITERFSGPLQAYLASAEK